MATFELLSSILQLQERTRWQQKKDPILRRLERRRQVEKLALEIVDYGFQALSQKFHPDTGGTAEQFQQLQDARTWLIDLLKSVDISLNEEDLGG